MIPTKALEPPSGHRNPSGARILLVGLYSSAYPAIGESHGLSVIAGCMRAGLGPRLDRLEVIDMVAYGEESLERVMPLVDALRPTVLAIGLQYGTFSVLKRHYPELRARIDEPSPLILFGGPIATYVGAQVLAEVEPQGAVVEGEGDEAAVAAVDAWLAGRPLGGIPNICTPGGSAARRLVQLERVPTPYRRHITHHGAWPGQVFVEQSRGCSWANCTFCLRGLTDVAGRAYEYRHFSVNRLLDDLSTLGAGGITTVTFADEDFFGGPLDAVVERIDALVSMFAALPHRVRFDVSATIRSLSDSRDSAASAEARDSMLRQLVSVGLNKVFLGIESASPSQLKRYAKGHSAPEAADACRRVLAAGARLEIGWIMFDPLGTPREVLENLLFLRSNSLSQYASSLTSEMRVHVNSGYQRLLDVEETRRSAHLYDRRLDPDTLSFPYSYVDPALSAMVAVIRQANGRNRSVYYPLKSLSRFGDGGALPADTGGFLARYRDAAAEALWDYFSGETTLAHRHAVFLAAMDNACRQLAVSFLGVMSSDEATHSVDPQPLAVSHAVRAARSFLQSAPFGNQEIL